MRLLLLTVLLLTGCLSGYTGTPRDPVGGEVYLEEYFTSGGWWEQQEMTFRGMTLRQGVPARRVADRIVAYLRGEDGALQTTGFGHAFAEAIGTEVGFDRSSREHPPHWEDFVRVQDYWAVVLASFYGEHFRLDPYETAGERDARIQALLDKE